MIEYYTITNIKGRLCVACTQSDYSKPVLITFHWPTVHSAAMLKEIVGVHGKNVMRHHGGNYDALYGTSWVSHSIPLRLLNGGQTLPIFTEQRPFVCPKSRGKETRYYQGYWQRLLASGWQTMAVPPEVLMAPTVIATNRELATA